MRRLFILATTVALMALPMLTSPVRAAAARAQVQAVDNGQPDPYVSEPAAAARTSRPLRDFAGQGGGGGTAATVEGLGAGSGAVAQPSAAAPDPVVQADKTGGGEAPQELTPPVVSFAGQNGADPPDPTGDVGPNDYVQMVNFTTQIWDKQGNPRGGPTATNLIWQNSGSNTDPAQAQCRTNNVGDPIVLYDQEADRWMLSQFTSPNTPAGPGGTFPMCIAYSQTSDPTGNWFTYQFNLPRSHDYMKYGIWPDGLYMSTWEGPNVGAYVFDRAQMLSGSPATFQSFSIAGGTGVDSRGNRILPADWDGANPPPSGAPNYFAMMKDGAFDGGNDRLEIFEFHTDWTTPGNTTFGTGLTNAPNTTLDTAAFDTDLGCTVWPVDGVRRQCIPQPPVGGNPSQPLDALANRLMARLQYRNFGGHQALVVNHTVDADGANRAGVRWYELRNTGAGWSIFQQGTYAPNDGIHRWMGTAAMDGQGDIAIGYSVSDGTTTFPGLRYTGRHVDDPLGSLPQGEQILAAGTTAETVARWGDYAGMAVDPVDDCTFWFTGERDNSATSIGSFLLPSCSAADLRITKSDAPDPVFAGQDVAYTLTVTNGGPNTANAVTVTDVLPAGVILLNTVPTCSNSAGTLTCPVGSLLSGQTATVVVQIHVPSSYLGTATSATLTNTATVAATNQTDPNPGNNTATATTTVRASADLAVTKVCKPDEPAAAGSPGFCDIYVDNLGPSDALGVTLTDVLTSATPFSVTGVTVSPSGTCSPTSSGPTTSFTTTCALGTVAAGGRRTIHVEVSAADVAQVNDVATVSSSTPDPNSSNNQATGRVQFTGSADLALDKTGPATVVAGTPLQYVITVTNLGSSTARNVVVTDTLPSGVSFVSVTPSQGTCTSGQPSARDLRCGLGDIVAGAPPVTITVNAAVAPDVPQGTILFNQAEVSSATADPDNGNNRDSVATTVGTSADLSITKGDSPDPVLAGQQVTYTITASNAGPSTASSVLITDTLPAGTTFVSGVNGNGATVCTLVQPGTVVCALGTLAPGASSTVFLTVKVSPSVPNGTVLHNVATVSSPTSDPTTGNNTTFADTTVSTSADLWLDKQATRRSGNPSPTVIYTLVVHNDGGCETDAQSTPTPTCGTGGPSDAQNVTVTDRLPLTPKKMVVQYVSPQCAYAIASHTVTCSTATIPAGASVTFVIEAQVSGSVGTITNTASVTSSTFDPLVSNNTNAASIVIKGGTGRG